MADILQAIEFLAAFKAALPPHLHAALIPQFIRLMSETLSPLHSAQIEFSTSTDPTVLNLKAFSTQLYASKRNLTVMKTLHKRAIPELVDNPRLPLFPRLEAAACLIEYYKMMYFYSLSHIPNDFPRFNVQFRAVSTSLFFSF